MSELPQQNDSNVTELNNGTEAQTPMAKIVTMAVVLTIIDVVTIVGNFLVLLSFYFEKKLRQPFNYYIFNLAVTDVLVGLTAMTFYTIDTLLEYWPFGSFMCGLWIFFDFAMTFASVFTLVAISIDRYWSVTWANHYRIHNTKKKTMLILAVVWVCVFIIWTPPFINDRIRNVHPNRCIWEPSENKEFVTAVAVIGHYVPCVLMVYCYLTVYVAMRKRAKKTAPLRLVPSSSRNIDAAFSQTGIPSVSAIHSGKSDTEAPSHMGPSNETNTNNSHGNQPSSKRERKIFVTLTYILVTYLICWFPFYITFDIYAWEPDYIPELLYTVLFWFTYINSTLNPFLYAYTNTDFRKAFLNILTCKYCRHR